MTKKRSRSKSAQLVPTAAAFTVAGVLIGGAGTVIQLASPALADEFDSRAYDAAGYPLTNPTGGWARQTDTDASSGAVMTVATPAQATVNRPAEHASTTNAPSTVKTTTGASTGTPVVETPTEPAEATDGSTTEQSTEPSTEPSTDLETDPPAEPDQTDSNADGGATVPATEGSCTATPADSTAEGLTATSSVLPAGAEVQVTNEASQQSIVVVITGESAAGCLSLSPEAFAAVAPTGMHVVDVHYAVLVEDAT